MTPNDRATESDAPSRRAALKGAAGLAAGTLVWSEPTLKGLARRPAYADAASGFSNSVAITLVVRVRDAGRNPRILSVSNEDPFGHGPLNFSRNVSGRGRPRIRLRGAGNQTAGNATARLVDVDPSSLDPGPLISFTPNNNRWIRWEVPITPPRRQDYTLTINFVCDPA